MEKVSYKGEILNELYNLVEKYPEMTMGEILHSFLRPKSLGGKSLVTATDEDIYKAMEHMLKNDVNAEDIMTEEEIKNWLEQ